MVRASVAVAVLVALAGCRAAPEAEPYFFVDHVAEAELSTEGIRAETVTLRTETRRALTTPLVSRVSYTVDVPENPAFRFAIGAATGELSSLLVPIGYRIAVDFGDATESVFETTLRRAQADRWFPHEVDLSRWAGRSVLLTFETGRIGEARPSAEENVFPSWGNPVLADRASRGARHDIVLISIDCLRADHSSVYGYERETDPNISAFSEQAVVFESPVAASSYTLPTHASMLTGLPPSLHGANVKRRISPEAPYVPADLFDAGYRVNGVVAAAFLSQTYGFERGFHTYRVTGGRAGNVVDEAIAVLHEGEGQTQFFFLHLYDLHAPYNPPGPFIDRFGARQTDVSELLDHLKTGAPPRSVVDVEQAMALYDGEIAYVDQELGRFFDALKERGLFDDALIILTADHGEAFQEHGSWQHGAPVLRDNPGLYEEILHVPLIVKWPGGRSSARVSTVVSQMDIAATILEVANLESPSRWSIGLRRYVDGDAGDATRTTIAEAVTFDETGDAGLSIALREEHFKYIASFRAASVSELYETRPYKEELYDLEADPGERGNLLEEGFSPGSFRTALRAYLEAARASSLDAGEELVLDEELLEELRALGYIDP